MINLQEYSFFIFDCDGVILKSNKLKTNAFAESLRGESKKLVRDFLKYHKNKGGISRYEKFSYYFKNLKKSDYAENETKYAVKKFAELVSTGLCKCDYIPGVIDFIKVLYDEKKPIFVVSGSDEKELKKVFQKRKILKYFKELYGSPRSKNDNTELVMNQVGYESKGCFFGDSNSDYQAAIKFCLDFVFVSGESEWDLKGVVPAESFYLEISDFNEICL